MISAESFQDYSGWKAREKPRSLAQAFEELRKILAEEDYDLQVPSPVDRENEFLKALDELSR